VCLCPSHKFFDFCAVRLISEEGFCLLPCSMRSALYQDDLRDHLAVCVCVCVCACVCGGGVDV
jgi:hypothetical protein